MTVEPVTADGPAPGATGPGPFRGDRGPTSVPRTTKPPRASTVGVLLRHWRTRRGLSQSALALDAGVSARHVSFVETGRSRPSARMIVRLAGQLQIPLPDRDLLLVAAGYAPPHGPDEPDRP
jgi:DNA-binding XRE family transcriptional regulator